MSLVHYHFVEITSSTLTAGFSKTEIGNLFRGAPAEREPDYLKRLASIIPN